MITDIAMMASLNNPIVLQTQIIIKNITPLISFKHRSSVQLEELINNNNSYGFSGAAIRFDLGGEDRALIPESVSTC